MPERTTTIRLTDEDQEVLEALQKETGIQSTTELIRLALRIALKSHSTSSSRATKRRPVGARKGS